MDGSNLFLHNIQNCHNKIKHNMTDIYMCVYIVYFMYNLIYISFPSTINNK